MTFFEPAIALARPILLFVKQFTAETRHFSAWRALVAVAGSLLLSIGSIAAAGVDTVDGQSIQGTPSFGSDGKVTVGAQQLPWEKIRVARFKGAPATLDPLPRGWHCEDIGKVVGNSSKAGNTFVFTTEGGEIKDRKYLPLHFAHRIVRSEPTIVARLTDVSGTKQSIGGVMIRDGLETASGFALLGVTGERKLKFETRENGWADLKSQDLGPVTLPVWVKITRVEKEAAVTAFRSSDGKTWQQVAQSKLSAHAEPYPGNSDHWKPRLHVGVALIAPTNKSAATLKLDQPSISMRGLLGEYYSGQEFNKLEFSRPDKHIEFWWGDRSPAPSLEPENFSVRWRGQVEPKFTENYRFYHESSGSRLWINGEELPQLKWEERRRNDRTEASPPKEVPLVAGRKYDLVFEFRKRNDAKTARLGWSSKSQGRDLIPTTALSYTFTPESPDEQADTTNIFHAAGIWLRDGSFLAGEIVSADSSSTQVTFAGAKPLTVMNSRIARVILRSNRRPLKFDLAAGRAGIFLQSGDFLESEIDQVNDRSVITSSVLFGRRSYSRENSHALAIYFAPVSAASAQMEVELTDGSILRARKVQTENTNLLIDQLALGAMRVPIAEVQEVRNLSKNTQRAALK